MNGESIVTPVGRLVQGDPFNPVTTDMTGKPRMDKQGNARSEWFIALAIAKNDPGLAELRQKISQAAQRDWPGGEWQKPTFFWKVIDGDDPKFNDKEGFAGHFVFRMTNGFGIKVYTKGGEQQITDPAQAKRGYYYRASVSVNGNKDPRMPGIFINVWFLELIGYGPEITGGPDPRQVFSNTPPAHMPPGMSATPVAAGPGLAAPVMTAAPGIASNAPVKPAYDFVDGPKAPAAVQEKIMTQKAGSFTYEQFIQAGWTDENLIKEGYMEGAAQSGSGDVPF